MIQANDSGSDKILLKKVGVIYSSGDTAITALDGCSLSVRANEFLCLLGPSGCGKSTILHLIAGFLEPTSGSVLINGRKINGPGADRGVVFQQYNLFPWKRVAQNIEFGTRLQILSSEERRTIIAEYLELMELTGFERSYPFQLSQGMQQRVGLARAYANDPEILLMDEPFASLDAQTGLRMRELLLRIWNGKQKTIVFVTHDIDEAIQLGDRVVIMTRRPGRIRKEVLIDLPRPRPKDFFLDSKYAQLRATMRSVLLDE